MNIDWGKVGAIATIAGVIIAILGIIVTIIIWQKGNNHKSYKTNKQVVKGTVFKNNKIVQSNSKSNCDDNEQTIEGHKFSDNDIKQEN